jgi:hypothetical protein
MAPRVAIRRSPIFDHHSPKEAIVPSVAGKELHTFTAEQFRAKAAEYAELLKHTDIPSERRTILIKRYMRQDERLLDLASAERGHLLTA